MIKKNEERVRDSGSGGRSGRKSGRKSGRGSGSGRVALKSQGKEEKHKSSRESKLSMPRDLVLADLKINPKSKSL